MRAKNLLSIVAIFALAALAFAPQARADVWNKKTIVTFPDTVELPGQVTLPSGTYVMKLADSLSNRHIVQVFNRDENKILATVLTAAAYRMDPADKTVITFYESPGETPRYIHKWFYPGDLYGQEFTYPKGTGPMMAKATYTDQMKETETSSEVAATAPVESSDVNKESEVSDLSSSDRSSSEENAVIAENMKNPESPEYVDETPAAEPAPYAPEAADQDAAQTPSATPQSERALPQTATSGPLVALIGMILLSSAAFVHFLRKVLRAAAIRRGL
jgi:LPXTG-motif cell wall-anchored protein